MRTKDDLMKNLIEKEIQKFYVVHARRHYCLECGRETWRPKICRLCLQRRQHADLIRRKAIIVQ